jgi:hypothetical protein
MWASVLPIIQWAIENRGLVLTAIGVIACFAASIWTAGAAMLICASGAALGFIGRASERIEKQGFQASLNANLGDLLLTGIFFGGGVAPVLLGERALIGLTGPAALAGWGFRVRLMAGEAAPEIIMQFADYYRRSSSDGR